MKKILVLMLALILVVSFAGCTGGGSNNETSKITVETNLIDAEHRTVTFSREPVSVEDLKDLDITDEYISACAIMFALKMYETDPETSIEMLDYMMDLDREPSNYDKDFLKNQFSQYPYVIRSYFKDSTPDNSYTVDELTLTLSENIYSRQEEGYVKIYLKSNGADSERGITLRLGDFGKYYLFSDSYMGICSGVVSPK